MSNAPRFQDAFLEGLAIAFRKRGKAVKHLAKGAEYAKVYETVDGVRMERLEIDLFGHGDTAIWLCAWPDRLIRLHAERHPKKRKLWAWNYEGRLLGNVTMPQVIEALEATCEIAQHSVEKPTTGKLDEPWVRLLARGPKLIE